MTIVGTMLYGYTMNENDKPLSTEDKVGVAILLFTAYLVGGCFTMFFGLGLNALGYSALPDVPTFGEFVAFYLLWPIFLIKFIVMLLWWLGVSFVSLLTF